MKQIIFTAIATTSVLSAAFLAKDDNSEFIIACGIIFYLSVWQLKIAYNEYKQLQASSYRDKKYQALIKRLEATIESLKCDLEIAKKRIFKLKTWKGQR